MIEIILLSVFLSALGDRPVTDGPVTVHVFRKG